MNSQILLNFEELTGYKCFTTFFSDFSIAEPFGLNAMKDTYKRAFNGWKHDYKYITELVMVLNWKSWQHAKHNEEYTNFYINAFYELKDWCFDNFTEEELNYFLTTTD